MRKFWIILFLLLHHLPSLSQTGGVTDTRISCSVRLLTDRNKAAPCGRQRTWGMLVTVTNDPSPSANITWYLKYNEASTTLTDNSNWVAASVGFGLSATDIFGTPSDGDLIVGNAGDFVLLSMGAEGTTLTNSGGQLQWVENSGAGVGYTQNSQTTDYTLQVADGATPTEVVITSGSARVVTIPTNANQAIPTQRCIKIRQGGTGGVTVTPEGGVTLNNQSGSYVISGQYGFCVVCKDATNTWTLDNPVPGNVANSQLATMAAGTIKGQPLAFIDGGSTTTPVDLTAAQARNIINNRSLTVQSYSDFLGSTSEYLSSTAGTGASVSYTSDGGDTGHPGVATISCGTTTTGSATVRTGNAAPITAGNGIMFFDCVFKLSALSDGTDTYTLFIGLNSGVAAANGAWFQYSHGVNSGEWQAITQVSGGNQNVEDTNVATTTAYTRLSILSNTNSTNYKFYINGTQVGTDHTTNVPTSGQALGFGVGIIKSAGTTARSIGLDYLYFKQELNTAR